MNFNEAKGKLLMDAIDALYKLCPRTVYKVTDDSVERMKVNRVELSLNAHSAVFVCKYRRGNTPYEGRETLTTVILDEDEAIKQWKEKGRK